MWDSALCEQSGRASLPARRQKVDEIKEKNFLPARPETAVKHIKKACYGKKIKKTGKYKYKITTGKIR